MNEVGRVALATAAAAAAAVDFSDLSLALLSWMPTALGIARLGSARTGDLAVQYYGRLRVAQIGEEYSGPSLIWAAEIDLGQFGNSASYALLGVYRRAVAAGRAPDIAAAFARAAMARSTSRYALAGGRNTIGAAVRGDGEAVGWRRRGSGGPCAFCSTLIGRGPVYKTAESAGKLHAYHDNCHCFTEPVFRPARIST
jgi:hypothetical protein